MERRAALRRLMNGTVLVPILGATALSISIVSVLRLNTSFRSCRLHVRCTHSNLVERVMGERCLPR